MVYARSGFMGMSAPPAGTILAGKFRVERELGSGGMGVVVEATHVALGQRVAIKLLSPELASSPEMLARFLREGRSSARLASDHVVRVSDVGQTEEGIPYLVMDLLVGHDLAAELIRQGRLAIPEAVDLILQACEGVAAAHAAGLVHRDLKPANLFLAQRPNRPPILKVLDFGLSKEDPRIASKSLTQENTVFGTPLYMSPEHVRSSKHVDARTDQHALAAILFELVTGAPPYDGESSTEVLIAIATQPPPHARALRPEVPRGLDAAIVRGLAKAPEARFADLAAFAEAIAPFGGQSAREAAAAVRLALHAGASAAPAPALQRISVPTDEQITVPRVSATPGLAGATLSGPFDPAAPRRRRMVVAGVMAALAGGIALVVALSGREAPPEPAPGAEPATTATGATASLDPALTVSAVRPAEPEPPASASAGTAPPTTSASAKPRPTGPSTVKKPEVIDVFGTRDKNKKK